jgi:hypothetical protein
MCSILHSGKASDFGLCAPNSEKCKILEGCQADLSKDRTRDDGKYSHVGICKVHSLPINNSDHPMVQAINAPHNLNNFPNALHVRMDTRCVTISALKIPSSQIPLFSEVHERSEQTGLLTST